MARRRDFATIAATNHTPSGGLRVPAALTRTGVLVYKTQGGGELREYRPAEEVFAPESLATLKGATVTELHPSEKVDTNNWKDLACGHVDASSVASEADSHVVAELDVNHRDTINKIEAKKLVEISCGYECDIDETPGVAPNGDKYDRVQRNIRYNHVALGPRGWGRAGPTVSLRLDSDDNVCWDEDSQTPTRAVHRRGYYMIRTHDIKVNKRAREVRIDGVPFSTATKAGRAQLRAVIARIRTESDEDLAKLRQIDRKDGVDASAFDGVLKAMSDLSTQVQGLMDALVESAAPAATESADADEEKQDVDPPADDEKKNDEDKPPSNEKMDSLVEQRQLIIDKAIALKRDIVTRGKSNLAIMREALGAVNSELRVDSLDAGEIRGAFLVAQPHKRHDSLDVLAGAGSERNDASDDTLDREAKYHGHLKDAWKPKARSGK